MFFVEYFTLFWHKERIGASNGQGSFVDGIR